MPGPAIVPPDYETAKRLARAGAEAQRIALAGLPGTTPELLYFLAADEAVAVRAAVAANAATPIQADRLLAGDTDPAVRAEVGRKLAPQAPQLHARAQAASRNQAAARDRAAAQDKLGLLGWRALCGLAGDAAEQVRAVIAEELKAMPDAPRELILRLAGDAAMAVAEPVIRLSPLLTEADLLALVAAPPVPATITAVARRPALSEQLCDAIAGTADETAIGVLLGNASASIREQTLDGLIVQAATRVTWQERLVQRPSLSPRALRALAMCVAGHLMEALAARPELEPGLAATLQNRVEARLAQAAETEPSAEQQFEDAAMRGDQGTMRAVLAAQAAVPVSMVERAARLRSAKGMVALCWQGGLGMRCAILAQSGLGHLAPGSVMMPDPAGDWPLTKAEMLWQIELLTELVT